MPPAAEPRAGSLRSRRTWRPAVAGPGAEGEGPRPDTQDIAAGPCARADQARSDHARVGELLQVRRGQVDLQQAGRRTAARQRLRVSVIESWALVCLLSRCGLRWHSRRRGKRVGTDARIWEHPSGAGGGRGGRRGQRGDGGGRAGRRRGLAWAGLATPKAASSAPTSTVTGSPKPSPAKAYSLSGRFPSMKLGQRCASDRQPLRPVRRVDPGVSH